MWAPISAAMRVNASRVSERRTRHVLSRIGSFRFRLAETFVAALKSHKSVMEKSIKINQLIVLIYFKFINKIIFPNFK